MAEAGDTDIRMRDYTELLRARHIAAGLVDERGLDTMELTANLSRLEARLMRDFESRAHRPLGLTWAGFRILSALWVTGGLEPRQLARISGGSRASVSSALNTLEDRGLAERRREATDRRLVRVVLTPAGESILEEAVKVQAIRERAWTDVLTQQEFNTLRRLLTKMAAQERPE